MKVLGIDPGYDRLGVSVVEKENDKEVLVFSDCIKTKIKENFTNRLLYIGNELEKIINKFKPNYIAIEKLYMIKNQKTGMMVSEARGVCMYIAGKHNIKVFEYTPIQIKETICGYGRADKKQIAKIIDKTIFLSKKKRLDDEYDAIATALTCIYKDFNILSTQLKK